ncbi:MAG TPA: hypothetical protein DCR93_25955 [Cytophagales bacterium]|nr:hypothetical protein [Cytophagales bacterium]
MFDCFLNEYLLLPGQNRVRSADIPTNGYRVPDSQKMPCKAFVKGLQGFSLVLQSTQPSVFHPRPLMQETSQAYVFSQLLQQVENTFRRAHPQETATIRDWKGQQIVALQEHLVATVQGRISEKWFYTYVKTEPLKKLPRVDMLDLLSAYVGFADWAAFVERHTQKEGTASPPTRRSRPWMWVLLLLGIAGLSIWLGIRLGSAEGGGVYRICVEDAIRGTLIEPGPIEVTILYEDQSPVRVVDADGGCLELTLPQEQITLVVSAPYYRPDTITRRWQSHIPEERLALRSDDFARMIYYFSTGKVEDYEKRRQQLNMMFHDEARIFQEDPETGTGIELYTKAEFVDKLTFPLASLQEIQVLELAYEQEKIIEMRFTQQE